MTNLHANTPFHNNRRMHAVEKHFTRHVARESGVFHELTSTYVHVDVHIVPPGDAHPFLLLFTTGMSMRPMTVPTGIAANRYAELAMLLPATWSLGESNWPVTWLVDLARLPHRNETFLAFGHTIPNGNPPRPIGEGAPFAGMLIGPSISLPDRAQKIRDRDEVIDVLTVWPIHADEMVFKLARCAHELFACFEEVGVSDVVDPDRPSVFAQ